MYQEPANTQSDFARVLIEILHEKAGSVAAIQCWISKLAELQIFSGSSLNDFITNNKCNSYGDLEIAFTVIPRIPGFSSRMASKLIWENRSRLQTITSTKPVPSSEESTDSTAQFGKDVLNLLSKNGAGASEFVIKNFIHKLMRGGVNSWTQFKIKFENCTDFEALEYALMPYIPNYGLNLSVTAKILFSKLESLRQNTQSQSNEPSEGHYKKPLTTSLVGFNLELKNLFTPIVGDRDAEVLVRNLTQLCYNIDSWESMNQTFKNFTSSNFDKFFEQLNSYGVFSHGLFHNNNELSDGDKSLLCQQSARALFEKITPRPPLESTSSTSGVSTTSSTPSKASAQASLPVAELTPKPFNFVAEIRSLFEPIIGEKYAMHIAGKMCSYPLCFSSWEAMHEETKSCNNAGELCSFLSQCGLFPIAENWKSENNIRLAGILFQELCKKFPRKSSQAMASSSPAPLPTAQRAQVPSERLGEGLISRLENQLAAATGNADAAARYCEQLSRVPFYINTDKKFLKIFSSNLTPEEIASKLGYVRDNSGINNSDAAQIIFALLHPAASQKTAPSGSPLVQKSIFTDSSSDLESIFNKLVREDNNPLKEAAKQFYQNLRQQKILTAAYLAGLFKDCKTVMLAREKFEGLGLLANIPVELKAKLVYLICNSDDILSSLSKNKSGPAL